MAGKVKPFPTEARSEVVWFSLYMEEKLQRNDHKPHWRKSETGYLLRRLGDELRELRGAMKRAKDEKSYAAIISECADVANFAMMIADHHRTEHHP